MDIDHYKLVLDLELRIFKRQKVLNQRNSIIVKVLLTQTKVFLQNRPIKILKLLKTIHNKT